MRKAGQQPGWRQSGPNRGIVGIEQRHEEVVVVHIHAELADALRNLLCVHRSGVAVSTRRMTHDRRSRGLVRGVRR